MFAVLAALMLPRSKAGEDRPRSGANSGEKLIMAEQTMINARNQPRASER
jgi:hypothetical protein